MLILQTVWTSSQTHTYHLADCKVISIEIHSNKQKIQIKYIQSRFQRHFNKKHGRDSYIIFLMNFIGPSKKISYNIILVKKEEILLSCKSTLNKKGGGGKKSRNESKS